MRHHTTDGDIRVDEDPGVAHHLDRVRERDATDAPERAQDTQDRPLLAQSVATREEEIDGIVAQTAADRLAPADIARVLRQRLHDAGLEVDADELDGLTERVLGRP